MSENKSSKSSTPVGGLILAEGDIELNVGRPTITMKVRNTGDRPIQVASHFHFFETNRYLEFDRARTFGLRLDIPSTTAIRFEPGDEKEGTTCLRFHAINMLTCLARLPATRFV